MNDIKKYVIIRANSVTMWSRRSRRIYVHWGGGGGALPSNRLMGMCRWMGSHFHDWIDYNGVAFSIYKATRMGSLVFRIWTVRIFRQVGSAGIKNIGRFAVQK